MQALMEALELAFLGRYEWHGKHWQRRKEEVRPGAVEVPANLWRLATRDVKALHAVYTGQRREFRGQRNPIHRHLGGYQFYYLPRNLFRTYHVLQSLPWQRHPGGGFAGGFPRGWIGEGEPFRVLDLGCGSGAFSLAVLAWLAGLNAAAAALPEVQFTLVDQARALTGMAEANLATFAARALPGLRLRIRSHAEGVEGFLNRSGATRHTLVGAAMMLNELRLLGPRRQSARAPATLDAIRRRAAEGGVILLVEPGTQQGYLNLMAARERLAPLPILYPCPHRGPCPLFDPEASRWCHATLALPRGFFFDSRLKGEGGLGFGMSELNMGALAVQAAESGRVAAPFIHRKGSRVVSDALPARPNRRAVPGRAGAGPGQVVLLCTPQGRIDERSREGLRGLFRGAWLEEPRKG